MKLKFNFNKRNRYKNICSIEGCNITFHANLMELGYDFRD